MPAKLTPRQRLKLVERALKGENIAALCLEAGISRTLLYRWIKRYQQEQRKNKIEALKPKNGETKPNAAVPAEKVKVILDLVRSHPQWSVAKIVANLPKDEVGKPMVGHHGVQNVLTRLDLNTIEKRQNQPPPKAGQAQILQYPPDVYSPGTPELSTMGKRRQQPPPKAGQAQTLQYPPTVNTKGIPELPTIGSKPVEAEELDLPHGELRPQDRLSMIERVKLGEPVARVCQLYGVSRTIFYRWLKRYNEAPEGKKLEALWDKKPTVAKYFNQAPQEYEQAVLAAVREYPEMSSHKLVGVLPKVGDKPILGNHGVQNVLRRCNLTTYQQRLAYAKAYHRPTPATRFFGIFETTLSFIGSRQPILRGFIVKGSLALVLGVFSAVIVYGASSLIGLVIGGPTITFSIGIFFSLLSLVLGTMFFAYSLKYYLTIAVVLSFSRHSGERKEEEEGQSFLSKIFGGRSSGEDHRLDQSQKYTGGGLQPDLASIELSRKPFVSIHLATYNEKRVVERLLTAATSMDYENYEVVVVDDSNDETVGLLKKWQDHPRVKVIHRTSREGFKGGALKVALAKTDPKAEFVMVFDADFIPYPDTITQFLKYFQSVAGGLDFRSSGSSIAAIQGYQWHVLNKSENWVTRGVRSEYAGSYVIERSGVEIYQGLKQVAGSVYMIRKDVLQEVGWETSITEDFQLTLRLYERGYKVVYTPYIQAPAEAVSTIKRLIRQRMRWAEGHSHNIKKMLGRLLKSPRLTLPEKLELIYLSPYYLQAFFFILGTLSWFTAEVIFRVRLPFWTEVWGWSLVFTNMLALPLMNMVGLFLEESEEKDYLGLFSFIALSYIVAPFQAYAALKGFLSKEEGPWFRTPKTGKITDIFTPGRFYRFIFGVLGRSQPAPVPSVQSAASNLTMKQFNNQYLSLATAHNQFNSFNIKPKRMRLVGKIFLALLLSFSVTVSSVAIRVPRVEAAVELYYVHTEATDGTGGWPSVSGGLRLDTASPDNNSNEQCGKYAKDAAGIIEQIRDSTNCATVLTEGEPTGGIAGAFYSVAKSGQYPAGTWSFDVRMRNPTVGSTTGDFMVFVKVYVYNGSTYTTQFYSIYKSTSQNCSATKPARSSGTAVTPSSTAYTLSWSCTNAPLVDLGVNNYLYVEYFLEINTASNSNNASNAFVREGQEVSACTTLGGGCTKFQTTDFAIPEGALVALPLVPFLPKLVQSLPAWWRHIRRKK